MTVPSIAEAKRTRSSILVKTFRKFRKPAPASFMTEVIVGGAGAAAGAYVYEKMTEEEKIEQPSNCSNEVKETQKGNEYCNGCYQKW